MNREEVIKNLTACYNNRPNFNFFWIYYNENKKENLVDYLTFLNYFPIYYCHNVDNIIRKIEFEYNIIVVTIDNKLIKLI